MQSKIGWFKRLQFDGGTRVQVYEMLALLLENRVLLIDALREIRGVFDERDDDEHRDVLSIDDVKVRNIRAEAVHDWILRLKAGDKDGFALARAMEPWVPHEEAALILAGEATGSLVRALRDAVKNIQGKGAMLSAVLGGTVYPVMLFVGAYFTMRLFAQKVVPRFALQVDPALWEGPAHFLYLETQAFNRFAVPGAIVLIGLLIASLASLPFMRGRIRVGLERHLPPWNLYKMIQGVTFLKNVAVQTRAGIKLTDSVDSMREMASPWLRERLDGALYGLEQGQTLGDALYNAGYEFPDRHSVRILRVLSSRDGFDETIYSFAERWEEATLKRVKRVSSLLLVAGVLAIGFVAGSTVLGMQGLTEMIDDNAEGVTNSVRN